MVDMGYSSEYEIYLTRSNGVQIVINSLSLTILREMRRREVSPSEIAALLDVPKSTIQGNIGKLLRMGIVSQDVRIDDARSAVYHIDALLMFSSDTDVEWQLYARSASVNRIIKHGRCTSREDLALYGVSLTESGLNVMHGLLSVGAALSRFVADDKWMDRMLSTMTEQARDNGIDLEFRTSDGLTLEFDSKGEDISDVPLVVVPMIGAIISHSKQLMDYNLAREVSLSVTENGHHVEMHVPPYEGQDYDSNIRIPRNKKAFRVSEPFSIYTVGGKATLFTNPTMMSVLDCLFISDYTLNELEEMSNLPKATIYAAISKLVNMGAVATRKETGSMMKYTLLADPIMYVTESDDKDLQKLESIVERFQKGEIDYYAAVISFAMDAIDCMGIHFDKMFTRAGKNAAISVLESNRDIKPQEFVELACSMVAVPDMARIRTYIPICLEVTLSSSTLWGSWPGYFVMGFVSEGLNHLLGGGYKATVVVKHEDQTTPVAVLES